MKHANPDGVPTRVLPIALVALGVAICATYPRVGDAAEATPSVPSAGAGSTAIGADPPSGAGRSDISLPPASELRPASADIRNAFAVRTWQPATSATLPPVAAPVVRAMPQAPALPYRFLARIADSNTGQSTFALLRETSVILARVGDELDSSYRLEAYEAGQLIFLYRPMNTRQILFVGLAP